VIFGLSEGSIAGVRIAQGALVRPFLSFIGRPVALATSLALGATGLGCYSETSVRVTELGRIHTGGQTEGTVVYGEDGGPVKLDPNTELRFTRRDGTTTDWLTVRDLSVNDDGVFLVRDADPRDLHSALVSGLSPEEIAAIDASTPDKATWFARGEHAVELQSGDRSLASWVDAIVRARGDVPGTWLFHCSPDVGPFTRAEVLEVMRNGLHVVDGLRWDDISSAEVRNLNHGETAVTVVAVTAIAVGVVTIVVASNGKVKIPDLGPAAPVRVAGAVGRGVGHVPRVLPRARIPGAVHVDVPVVTTESTSESTSEESAPPADPAAAPADDTASDDGEAYGLGASWLERPKFDDVRPLFDGGARRQSIVRLVTAFDAERDFSATPRTHVGLAAAARFYNFFEIGGGLRWLGGTQNLDGSTAGTELIPFARIGLNTELDAHRRFAIPIAVDLGAGSDVGFYFKLVFGLRVRVTDTMSLGAYVFNPTLVSYRSSTMNGASQWSFPSGVEASFAF
jgi:hypothetical protein